MAEKSDRIYKVVLTGFGPFQNVEINESWQAVSGLWEHKWPDKIKLVTRELPVVYDVVKNEIEKLWQEENPDLIIHVGVHRGADQILIEKRSFNTDYSSEDVNDKCPKDLVCVSNGCEILETKLNVDKLCKASNQTLETKCFKARCDSSTDPGRYLCGYSYYLSLSYDCNKSLFVHVPGDDLFPVKEMTISLRLIILEALNQLYNVNFEDAN